MWNLLGVALGVAVFLLGLRVMCRSLAAVGASLSSKLKRATQNRYQAFAIGFLVTALVQSSSVINAMTVGLVDSGILGIEQAFAIMLGANVGTTMTVQLMALPLSAYAPYLIPIGIILRLLSRRARLRNWSSVLIGMGSVFYGLAVLHSSLAPLGHLVVRVIPKLNPLGGPAGWIAVGVVATAIIQSSSAVTGLTIALVQASLLSSFEGVCIALGSNIGTVLTTLLASVGLSLAARKAALAELTFNVLGVVLIYPFLDIFSRFVHAISPTPAAEIANAHTFFNLITAGVVLPLFPVLLKSLAGDII